MTDPGQRQPLVYVVEDSRASGALYQAQLQQAGYEVCHQLDGHSALVAIGERMPDVVVLDVFLPDISGLEVLDFINRQPRPARVIVVTSNSSIDVAVNAIRRGGFDFIEKPFQRERLLNAVDNALRQIHYEQAADTAQTRRDHSLTGAYFIGDSPAMQAVFRTLDSAASSNACVFITGESGTGKEVCALALHESGARKRGPFIAINCAAIPTELFESEFFGHIKGSFSGASSDRKGAAELAHGGTLFLDELCEMDLNLQAKLLRFLQTGSFTPVGGTRELQSDVRIVCATNRTPAVEVREGRLREDLYYRLNVIPLHLPPLRERDQDVLLLARHFLRQKAVENHKQFQRLSADTEQHFLHYAWPGNVRELQNVIENVVVMHDGERLERDMLPATLNETTPPANRSESPAPEPPRARPADTIRPLAEVEREAIEQAIASCDNNIPLAAAYLGISASTIYRKMKAWKR